MAELIQKRVGTAKDGKPIFAIVPKTCSKEHQGEYRLDKRIQELTKRGYNSSNIRYMIGHDKITEKRVMKGQKAHGVNLDGAL